MQTPTLLHHLVSHSAEHRAQHTALVHKKARVSYVELERQVHRLAVALNQTLGLRKNDRVAVFLPKQVETVVGFFATAKAGSIFVPVNPVLKAAQVAHILNDCEAKILITSKQRLQGLSDVLADCSALQTIVLTDGDADEITDGARCCGWQELCDTAVDSDYAFPDTIDADVASILYTSGSTGRPKGVVLSHRNIVAGAASVSEYLGIDGHDRLLAVLPFSFDYGLNQLTSSLLCGATCVLLDYLLPKDVITTLVREQITGLAAVPPLWVQLSKLEWPDAVNEHLRYMTNSGGKMPDATLNTIRGKADRAKFFLMYGLTEAFRSTYLPPDQIDHRPGSMGKAIPNAEIMVVRPDGTPCDPDEPGELVHRGCLVALGYWNDPDKTAERFKPAPGHFGQLPLTEIAVWSGDTVTQDADGYLYFVGRQDDMIKTSGYRVSPTEVEECVYASTLVDETVALGVPHPDIGEAILLIVKAPEDFVIADLVSYCRKALPNFMVPTRVEVLKELPRNPNGKIDRNQLKSQFTNVFASQ